MRILCIIPARSSSVRIKHKSLSVIDGRTLVRLAFDCAAESGVCSDIAISSDQRFMADGLPWVERPVHLSGETADIASAIAHAITVRERDLKIQFDYVVTLQPTIPVRDARLLRKMVEDIELRKCKGALTGVPIVPWTWVARGDEAENSWTPNPYPRSQSFVSECRWQEINAVQIADRDSALSGQRWGLPLLIQLLPPYAVLDIDDAHDLATARVALRPILSALAADKLAPSFVIRSINGLTELPTNDPR